MITMTPIEMGMQTEYSGGLGYRVTITGPDWLNKKASGEAFCQAMREMDQEDALRLLYVPFVIQDVFFDYVETSLHLAAQLKIEQLKRVCREIRAQRREYEYRKSLSLDRAHRKAEETHTEEFIDEHFPEFNAEYRMICWKIRRERPRLNDDYRTFVASIYMGMIIYKALVIICREADRKIAEFWGDARHSILTDEVVRTRKLLETGLGDCNIIREEDLRTSASRLVRVIHECTFTGKLKWD